MDELLNQINKKCITNGNPRLILINIIGRMINFNSTEKILRKTLRMQNIFLSQNFLMLQN